MVRPAEVFQAQLADANPGGLPKSVFDGVIQNWWRQGNDGRCEGPLRGMPATEAETINADLLEFIQS